MIVEVFGPSRVNEVKLRRAKESPRKKARSSMTQLGGPEIASETKQQITIEREGSGK